jgi:hypothetical protein
LKNFGYIEEDDSTSGALYTEEGISGIIKTVQKFGALEQTGQLDNDTLAVRHFPHNSSSKIKFYHCIIQFFCSLCLHLDAVSPISSKTNVSNDTLLAPKDGTKEPSHISKTSFLLKCK